MLHRISDLLKWPIFLLDKDSRLSALSMLYFFAGTPKY